MKDYTIEKQVIEHIEKEEKGKGLFLHFFTLIMNDEAGMESKYEHSGGKERGACAVNSV